MKHNASYVSLRRPGHTKIIYLGVNSAGSSAIADNQAGEWRSVESGERNYRRQNYRCQANNPDQNVVLRVLNINLRALNINLGLKPSNQICRRHLCNYVE